MTPDYQRKDVVFEDQLQEMLQKDNIKREVKAINSAYYAHNSLDTVMPMKELKVLTQNSFDGYKPEIIRDYTGVNPETGNNVNIESEMMDMAKVGIISSCILASIWGLAVLRWKRKKTAQ